MLGVRVAGLIGVATGPIVAGHLRAALGLGAAAVRGLLVGFVVAEFRAVRGLGVGTLRAVGGLGVADLLRRGRRAVGRLLVGRLLRGHGRVRRLDRRCAGGGESGAAEADG